MKTTNFLLLAALTLTALCAVQSVIAAKPQVLAPYTFERIFIIQFENQPEEITLLDPNFAKWASKGVRLSNMYAITHPSQPNYWTQVAGDHFGINSNENFDLNYTTIADLLEAKGLTWKTYQEDYPGNCDPRKQIGKYFRKHNPFISFNNIRNNPRRCANIVNAAELDFDLKYGLLPHYSYYTPNIDNDGHDSGVAFAGKYLDQFFSARYSLFPNNTLIVITFDEDDYNYNNHIYTVLLGDMVQPGTVDNTRYNHYSLLRTVEENWRLGNLGRNDVNATSFQCLRKRN